MRALSAIGRREFLQRALAASAALLFENTGFAGSRNARRVIVIGAGFGGLACAHELLAAGCDVTVLEARNRIGGRVVSLHDLLPGEVVEGGGELIGRNHPMWLAFAQKFGLELVESADNTRLDWPVLLDGKRLSRRETDRLAREIEFAQHELNDLARNINAEQPWKSANATQLDLQTTAQWIRALNVSHICRRALTVIFSANNGVATSRQSLLANLAQVKGGGLERYWTDTELYRCRGGNAQLAQKLAGVLGNRLRLATPVRAITVSDRNVIVRDAGGHAFEADDLVLAVPPSTWSHITFSPALPRALRPQMGLNVKYLAHLKRAVWRDAQLRDDALTDGIVNMTWRGGDHATGTRNTVLTSFSGGPAAERARQQFTQRGDAAYLDAIEEIYRGFRSSFIRGRFMDWPNELWTQAGYSFPAPGQITAIGPTLHSGIGRLHFAGEHTCYAFVGYMEGALQSGVSLAKRLVRRERVLAS